MKMLTKMLSVAALTAVMLTGSAVTARAQQSEKAPEPKVPLKVTVVVSRFDGEKKTGSLPFVLWVNTGDSNGGSIQMGAEVPIPYSTTKDGQTTTSYNMKSLGTNVTCNATAMGDGLYRLSLTVQDSQVFRQPEGKTEGMPSFQSFKTQNSPILKDGQTVQFAVATDKTSGEVIKLDVTLNVVK